ncbi:MAG: hypothetical protein J6T47_05720 [Lachnospiraceae bacterium]|nr:hypothetical protein [Lachnospiraceae bacterium]
MKKTRILTILLGLILLMAVVTGCTPESPPLPPLTGDAEQTAATQETLSPDELKSKAAVLASEAQGLNEITGNALDAFNRAKNLTAPADSQPQASESKPAGPFKLTVRVQGWTGWSEKQPEPKITDYDSFAVGDEVYDNITIESIGTDSIVLAFADEGLGYVTSSGSSINLRGEPLKTLEVTCGVERCVVTQTMDAGTYLYFLLEQN